jgi:hypothetical protein
MICPTCTYYAPLGQPNPIAARCTWRPTPEQRDQLRAILPAPSLSRALVMPAPHQVEACGAFEEVGE